MARAHNRSRRIFLQFYFLLATEFIKQIYGINFFCDITHQEIDIILRDLQTTVTEKPRKRYHVAAVQNPLSCKGMTVSVNTGGLNAAAFVILREHMITRAFHKLLTKHIAKEKVFPALIFTIF